MLILSWKILEAYVMPVIGVLFSAVINSVMPIVVMCVGMSILLSIVNVRIGHFWGAIGNGVSRGLGFVGRTIISAIGWCLRHFFMFIPTFYVGVRNSFRKNGSSEFISNLFAIVVTLLLVVLVI